MVLEEGVPGPVRHLTQTFEHIKNEILYLLYDVLVVWFF